MERFRKKFGVVGTNYYSVGGYDQLDGNVWTEVEEERPTVNHVLSPDGKWELDEMMQWEKEMGEIELETIPRWFEDHLVDDHGGVTGNPFLQEKLNKKLAKRAEKP